jgi:hypothetical protein
LCLLFYMCRHAEARGRVAGRDSLCWLLPCLLARAERGQWCMRFATLEEPRGRLCAIIDVCPPADPSERRGARERKPEPARSEGPERWREYSEVQVV